MSSAYLLKRLLWALPTLFGVAVVVFVLLRVVPGDPIAMMLPPGARAEDIARLRHMYGLDASDPGAIFHVARAGRCMATSAIPSACAKTSSRSVLGKLPATLELVALARC